jgi:hypothetical protein
MYDDAQAGQPPVPPAQLVLATILQAYTGASDDEVIEATVMDRRWQLVLDCMDQAVAPFSKTTLVAFRAWLIAHGMDRRLVERTVALYGQTAGRVAGGKLRAALDSSPLWGAGRDSGVGGLQSQGRVGSGLDDPAALPYALGVVLGALDRVEALAAELPGGAGPQVVGGLAAARQVRDQDTMADTDGGMRVRQGWPGTGGSRSRTHRCAPAARPAACGSTATNATCSPTWTPGWFPRSG